MSPAPRGERIERSALNDILERDAARRGNQVWVAGAFVDRVPTLPLEGGAAALARFALDCWRRLTSLQAAGMRADDELQTAERILQTRVNETVTPLDLAAAYAAVKRARARL